MLANLFSIFLDYQCNYSCAHCSVGSSPKTKMKMPDHIFDKFLDDLADIKSARVAVFTGGEATLHLDMLKRGLSRTKALGLRTRVVSNVWWAKTPKKAVNFLRDLKEAGLDELNSSFDDYRLPFTDFNKIINAALACRELDMPFGIGVIRDKNASWDEHRVRAELARGLDVDLSGLDKYVAVLADHPTPSGTGEQLDVTGLDAGSDKLDIGCMEVLKTVSIHPNGSVKACCGHVMFYSQDLAVGNIKEEPLKAILERGQQNAFYWWIHMMGPKRILDRLGVKGTYASQCHACQVLTTQHRDKMIEYLHENREKVIKEDILLSDNFKKVAKFVATQEERIDALIEV